MRDSGFGGPDWSRSTETSEEEEVERILKAALLAVGAGAVEVAGVNAKHLGMFMHSLKYR